MKTLSTIFSFGLMALVVLTAGCSTTATVTTLQPIEGGLDRYKKAVVAVTTSPDVQWRDEAKYVESRLKFGVVEKLKATKKFQDVQDMASETSSQASDSDLKIAIKVVSLRSYSGGYGGPGIGIGVGGGSGGVGGFYGLGMGTPLPAPGSSGGMIVQVELLDGRSGKRLGFMDASATSGDIAAQTEAIAEKVVAEIARK